MHKLYELKEKLMDEMGDYSQNGKYSKEDVESIKYLSSAVDHLCNIIERYEDEEYSNADGNMMIGGGSYERGGNRRSNRGGSYGSYARGRRGNVRRDSMGRYSSEGYSRGEDEFRMDLQELMQDAPNDQVRQKLQRIMSEM